MFHLSIKTASPGGVPPVPRSARGEDERVADACCQERVGQILGATN